MTEEISKYDNGSGINTPPTTPTKVLNDLKEQNIAEFAQNDTLKEISTKTIIETPTEVIVETVVMEPVNTEAPVEPSLGTQSQSSTEEAVTPIQLISEDKQYNSLTLDFLKSTIAEKADIDRVNYHFISVFGSQSTGKSTLLNNLFHTNFDTMDAQVKRQQTTKGIWLGHAKNVSTSSGDTTKPSRDLFVLDVEGSDGAERGEDQEFERKAALFALSVSEVLIINMWEHQVGLYQGNNMELLKTVFEVNLSLFGKNKIEGHKILLLFVIRDHIGVTPIESLKASLLTELEKMWSLLSQPEGTKNSSIFDYFDFEFRGIGHKYLQYEQFMTDVKLLGDSFTTEDPEKSFFKKEYHHNLPLDGWNLYSENCWMTIENSVELDLPTQQILVAKFKTKEFSDAAFEKFQEYFSVYDHESKSLEEMAVHFSSLKQDALNAYDEFANRYNKQVYQDERSNLGDRIYKLVFKFLSEQSEEVGNKLTLIYKETLGLDKKNKNFVERNDFAKSEVLSRFENNLSVFMQHGLLNDSDRDLLFKGFKTKIEYEVNKERTREFSNLVKKFEKNMKFKLQESLELLIMEPTFLFWSLYNNSFNKIFNDLMGNRFKSPDGNGIDFKLGFDSKENELKYNDFKVKSWIIWKDVIGNQLTVNKMPGVLEETFKKKFLFDENDSPRFFTNVTHVDQISKSSKDFSLKMLDIYSVAKNSPESDEKIKPDVSLAGTDGDDEGSGDSEEDDDEFTTKKDYGDILSDTEKEKIRIEFNKKIQLVILQTKRSILSSNTRIPPYMFLLLAVLGFNEFMMILRHPLLLTVCLLSITGWYFVHRTGSYRAVQHIALSSLEGVKDATKQRLRDLLKENELSPAGDVKKESFEMEDLSSSKEKKD